MKSSSVAVAVTGATGFIGKHVLDRLSEENYEIRILSRTNRQPSLAGAEIILGDIGDPESLRTCLKAAVL